MFNAKKEVYQILKSINEDYNVMQSSQAVLSSLPTITFYVVNNGLSYDLDGQIVDQTVTIAVDIFTNSSSKASDILTEVEQVMRNNGYMLEFSQDVSNPTNDNIFHIHSKYKF